MYLILLLLLAVTPAFAEPLHLGMTTALSGPSYHLGTGMAEGMKAYFEYANSIDGNRKIKLTVMDDGYEANKALENAKYLINKIGVTALVGNVGTPTAKVVLPIVIDSKKVFYAALTGASFLRTNQKYVVNFRDSYRSEMQEIVDHLHRSEIAPDLTFFLLQGKNVASPDPFGQEGWDMAIAAFKGKGFLEVKPHTAYYVHNALSVRNALEKLLLVKPNPKAVVIVGTVKPSARFIVRANKLVPGLKFYNLSFVGSSALAAELKREDFSGEVYATRVVCLPDELLNKEIHASLNLIGVTGEVTDIHVEGYLAAKHLVDVVQGLTGDIDSELLWQALHIHPVQQKVLLTKLNQQHQWIIENDQ